MIARAVESLDPEWRAWGPARPIILRGQLDDDRLSGLRLIEPFDREARDEPRRQMEQHIDDALQPPPGQRLGTLRPDAFPVRQGGQERIEYLGSQHRARRL